MSKEYRSEVTHTRWETIQIVEDKGCELILAAQTRTEVVTGVECSIHKTIYCWHPDTQANIRRWKYNNPTSEVERHSIKVLHRQNIEGGEILVVTHNQGSPLWIDHIQGTRWPTDEEVGQMDMSYPGFDIVAVRTGRRYYWPGHDNDNVGATVLVIEKI